MSVFRLKRFEVIQDRAALKVGTDSTLLGAYVAHAQYSGIERILDVGTGTGIIALMLAQQYQSAHIDAIEIDPPSAEEAGENFQASPWSKRLTIHQGDFLHFTSEHQYHLIISNPPYFTDTHYNNCDRETVAKHMQSLPPEDFFRQCDKLLAHDSKSRVITITAISSLERFTQAAHRATFFPHEQIFIHPRNGVSASRVISIWQRSNRCSPSTSHLDILVGTGRHDYSVEFTKLLSPYLIILPDE